MLKRILSLFLAAFITVTITACGKPGDTDSSATGGSGQTTGASDDETAATGDSTSLPTDESGVTVTNGTGTNSDGKTQGGQTTAGTNPGNSGTPKTRNYTIKTGTKGVEVGLDFGGKTFTMATYSDVYDTSFTRRVNSFQTKYNCRIKVEPINFVDYVKTAAVKKSAGTPYDILCYVHGSMFPNLVLSNVAMPLTDKITTADLMNVKDPFAGGFDLDKSEAYEWNKQLYALAGADSVFPYLVYYNRLKFEEAGLDDPNKLYQKGKWNWKTIVSMGKEVTNVSKDIYFGCRSFYGKAWVMANGGHYITEKNGKMVENLTSPKIVNALTWLREIMTGSERIVSSKGGAADPSQFYKGNTYVYIAEANRYPLYAKDVEKQSAFDYDKANLGVAPIPLGPDNKDKEYPTGWVNAHAAGAGTGDVRAAVAWAKFMTTYRDPIQDKYALPKSDKAMAQKLISGRINYPDYGYATSSTNINQIVVDLETAITTGSPVSTTLEKYRKQVQNCIDAALKS